METHPVHIIGTNLVLLGNRGNTHILQKIARGVQLKQDVVMLTQKTRMDTHSLDRIVDLVLLDNLESTNSINNKASGVQLNQEVVVLTQKIRSTCNGLIVKFHRISTNIILLDNLGSTQFTENSRY